MSLFSRSRAVFAAFAAFGLLASALPAAAHVEASLKEAKPGQSVEIALEVGHGCAGAPTTALRVSIPAELQEVRPLETEGWTSAVVTAKGAPDGRVSEISWEGGSLGDHDHGAFRFAAKVAPGAREPVVLPVIQICDDVQVRWIETGAGAAKPAPIIRIVPGS